MNGAWRIDMLGWPCAVAATLVAAGCGGSAKQWPVATARTSLHGTTVTLASTAGMPVPICEQSAWLSLQGLPPVGCVRGVILTMAYLWPNDVS